ncbi:uncharacterized protein LOC110744735 [Prunus avium]|uniref:Uncharacterized protein LOC110744735 n=1 Tax=Prunus avium TaxID=42229 RepID=A0A6P5RHU2_PRUAV|nr:uncharacterized protein LOC110744735 [Prunus avium]
MKDEKLDDEEEREDEDEKGGEKVHAVENDKGDVEYITPEINWDDPALVCVTLVNFLKNPCRKWKVAMEEGDADDDNNLDDDVVVRKVQKKRGRAQSSIVEPAMKRPKSVECKTPWQRQEIPNIGEETVGLTFDPLRPVRRGLLLETAKFFWEWGQKENTHVRLCGKHGVDTSHDFFIRLLTKDGWLNDTNIDMGLYLLRVRQTIYANLVRSDWAIVDTLFQTYAAIDLQHMRLYGGKEDRTHSNALVKMVNGKLPTWGKPWSSVKKVFMPYNVSQKHWVGLVLDLTSCEIFVYDSNIDLFRTHILVKAVQPLAKLITPLLEEAGYVGDFPLRKGEWPIHRVMDSAQQVGGGDCGMFVIKYCDFLSWNVELGKISNEAMHLFRLKLTVDLLQGCYNI